MKDFNFKNAKNFFENQILYTMSPFALNKILKEEVNSINLIDVRQYEDYLEGHIVYAQHIPYEEIEDHLNMLEKEKMNIIYCYNEYCNLAQKAALKVLEHNFPVKVLLGGYKTWHKYDYEIVSNIDN